MREVYLVVIILANFLSSLISFNQENYIQGGLDCLFFTTAIMLLINPLLHVNWFITIICLMYSIGIMTTYKVVPRWSTMYRGIIVSMGIYLLIF